MPRPRPPWARFSDPVMQRFVDDVYALLPVTMATAGPVVPAVILPLGPSLSLSGLSGVLRSVGEAMLGDAPHSALTSIGANDHHAQAHVVTGADHTDSGLTAGYVLRASAATAFGWAQLGHGDLGGVSADQHHAQGHLLTGGPHTETGLTTGHVLTATGATTFAWQAGGANTALSNLAAVAVNAALIGGADNTLDLGSATYRWRTGYLGTSLECPIIKPAADGTTAFKITKADGTSTVVAVDTTNRRLNVSITGADQGYSIRAGRTTSVSPTGTVFAMQCVAYGTLTADSPHAWEGVNFQASVNQNGFNATETIGSIRGMMGTVSALGDSGTVASAIGINVKVANNGAGTLTEGVGINIQQCTNLGTFGTFAGIRIAPQTEPTNIYGVQCQIVAAANRWNLYISGTAINYMAGNVLLGTTTDGMTAAGSIAIAKDLAHRGTYVGFFNTAPIAKVAAMTTQLTAITFTAPGTPDYALQDVTQTTPWGFADGEEARSFISVVSNLQTRLAEVETKLKAYGLFT